MKLVIKIDGKEVTYNELLKRMGSLKPPVFDRSGVGEDCGCNLITNQKSNVRTLFDGHFDVQCFGQDGNLKWEDTIENIVTNVGLQHILDILFVSATVQVDPWYVGLTDSTPTVAAGDTMSSHAGWAEDVNYSDATRQAYVDVRSGQSVTNSASKASFSINGTTTIGGAFLSSDSTKSGTSGTLLCVGAFTGGDKAVGNDDTLQVTYTFTAADDGA